MAYHRWTSALTGLGLVLALALAPAAPAIAGSQYVIVSAEPASDAFPAGKLLAPGDTLNVPEGTIVTILGEDGSVNAIPGPAEVAVTEDAVTTGSRSTEPEDAKRTTLSKIADLLAGERERAESLGVSRGFNDRPKPEGLDDPWAVSVHDSAAACIRDGELVLARKDPANAIGLSYRIGEAEAVKDQVWRSGESKFTVDHLALPSDTQMVVEAGKEFAKIELRFLPESINLKNPLDVMGWMIESGCDRQAIAFARDLARNAQ